MSDIKFTYKKPIFDTYVSVINSSSSKFLGMYAAISVILLLSLIVICAIMSDCASLISIVLMSKSCLQ